MNQKNQPDGTLTTDRLKSIEQALTRIADRLDQGLMINNNIIEPNSFNPDEANAFVWESSIERNSLGQMTLLPVHAVNHVPLNLLCGIDHQIEQLSNNTRKFAQGLPANNVLLWGARGTGKSSLIKAIHADMIKTEAKAQSTPLKLIEIHREDIGHLPHLLHLLRGFKPYQFILFCDDLSFDRDDQSYKSLKAVLEGGVEGRPANVIFYATSNRRHLMPRDMIDNERSTAINPSEAIEEKISLSDRFGLWIGFHNISQDIYLAMIENYIDVYKIPVTRDEWRPSAIEWSVTRGARSGRVAWQFIQDIAGDKGVSI